jgi:hypothetical protein
MMVGAVDQPDLRADASEGEGTTEAAADEDVGWPLVADRGAVGEPYDCAGVRILVLGVWASLATLGMEFCAVSPDRRIAGFAV